jgi:hypothetical protein
LHLIAVIDTHTHTKLSRSPPDEGSAGLTDLYMATHKTHNRQTSTPLAGLESAVPASERPQGSACKGVSRCAVHIRQDAMSVLIFLLEDFIIVFREASWTEMMRRLHAFISFE